MSTPDEAPRPAPNARSDYDLLCVTALMLLLLALVMQRMGAWSLFPVVLGAAALFFRWRMGPILVVLAVVLLVLARSEGLDPYQLLLAVIGTAERWLLGGRSPRLMRGFRPPEPSALASFALAVGVLAYCAGHYRLQGLLVRLFPPDPRRRPATPTAAREAEHRRPAHLVTLREVAALVLAVPALAGLAVALWSWVRDREPPLDFEEWGGQALVLLWVVGGGTLVVAGLLRYLAQRRLTPDEAAMYLQDQMWRETRREQRRLNRWLAWAWLRRRRREEGS
jgi:hypothetical protein